jgi:hypothetical protein
MHSLRHSAKTQRFLALLRTDYSRTAVLCSG